jgi:dienelactone hydrolase
MLGKRDGIRLMKGNASGYRDSDGSNHQVPKRSLKRGGGDDDEDYDDDDERYKKFSDGPSSPTGGFDGNVPLSLDGRRLPPRRDSARIRQLFKKQKSSNDVRMDKDEGFPIYFTISMASLIAFTIFLIVCVVMYNLQGQVGWGSLFDPNAMDAMDAGTTCDSNYTSFCSTSLEWIQNRFTDLIYEAQVPANHQVLSSWNTTYDGTDLAFSWEQISTTPTQNMTMIVGKSMDSENETLPVLIYVHSTSTTAQDMYDRNYVQPFVKDGYLVFAIDQRYHGKRESQPNNDVTNTGPYYDALLNAWKNGRSYPYIYETVQDVIRLLDYLETRDDVDYTRIGITGISSGGHIAWRCGVADDRIAAVATIIGVEDTRNSLENDIWYRRVWTIRNPFIEAAVEEQGLDYDMFNTTQDIAQIDPNIIAKVWGRINPGILDEQNAVNAILSISPRPLFILAAQNDTQNGDPDAVVAISELVEAQYMNDGADGSFQFYQQPNNNHAVWPGFNDQIREFMNSAFMNMTTTAGM